MKKLLFTLPLLISLNGSAQNISDLFMHIDSLIQFELHYVYDSTTDQPPNHNLDSTKLIMTHFGTFPSNPSPLILLDGKKVSRIILNEYNLSQTAAIDLYKKDDIQMRALYGTVSKNGAIIIQTNRFLRKKRKE